MSIVEKLLTVEEYAQLSLSGPTELVRGEVVELNRPTAEHGVVCNEVAWILNEFVRARKLGRVMTNDAGIITQRNPDSVRGGDVVFLSYQRLAPGPAPKGYLRVAPEVVFEVRSPSDRWPEITAKAAEYLSAGVLAVIVLDPEDRTSRVFRQEEGVIVLEASQELSLPELHAEFQVPVARFFE